MALVVDVLRIIGPIVATLYGFGAVKNQLIKALELKVDLKEHKETIHAVYDELKVEREARIRLEEALKTHKQVAHGEAA